MIQTIRTLVCLSFLFSSQWVFSQWEAQQWLSLGLEYKLDKHTSIEFEQGWRITQLYRTNTLFSDLSISHKFSKHFKVNAGYRFTTRDGNWFNYGHIDHRFFADAVVDEKFGDFKLAYRMRMQNRHRDWFTSEDGKIPEWILRNKFSVDYDLGDFTPGIGIEFWLPLNKTNQFSGFNQYRLTFGTDYKINKKIKTGFGLFLQKEFNTNNPDQIMGFSLSAKFELN